MDIWRRLKSDYVYIKGLLAISATSKMLKADGDLLVSDDLEEKFDQWPERVAFHFEGKDTTYAELESRANRFANWALCAGLEKGDCVALYMGNQPDYVAFWIGMLKVGMTCAMINNNLTGKGLAHCLDIVDAQTIVTTADLLENVATAKPHASKRLQIWSLGGAVGDGALDMNALMGSVSDKRPERKYREGIKSGDIALYIYTSGTTGLPKAAKITHIRTIGFMRTFVPACNITKEDRIYLTLPLYHATGGICGVGSALQTGAAIILKDKFSASSFWSDAKKGAATMFVYIGEFGRYLMNQPPSPAERDHKIVKAFGNGLRGDVWREITARTGIEKIVEFYGSTEGNVSFINLDSTPGAIGRVPPLLTFKMPVRLIKIDPVTEEPMRNEEGFCIDAEIGEPGEAIGPIKNDDPRLRYDGYKDQKASEKKVLHDVFELGDNWFRTGDLLRRDKLNYFYFVDRLGDTYRWKGENVSTNEVAEAVSSFEGIEIANVYGVEVPGREGRAGMAALTLDRQIDYAKFFEHVTAALPDYAVPIFLRIRTQTDTTGTMKLKKVDLVKAGYDPSAITDELYFRDEDARSYVPITPELFKDINSGKVRL